MIEGKITHPEISVVMSVFNEEIHLRSAIDSVLNQTYKNFEFIIVNDHSTDKTPEILKEYEAKDNRIILFEKPINKGFKGFVENLNIGISKARGRYIARMDADDICFPERFEKQFNFLEKNPQVFLTGASMILINEKGDEIGRMEALSKPELIRKRAKIDNPIFHPTLMFRNEPGLTYRDKLYACEDFDFHLIKLSENRILYNLSEPLLKYRILENSISRKGNSFVKRLFLEQAKTFYKQRIKSSKDEYENFDESEFLNILNPDFQNSKTYLTFAANVAILYGRIEELKIINQKLKKQHGQNSLYFRINEWPVLNKLISFANRKLR